MLGWLIGLKGKLIALGALILAILSGLAYERHKGKQEGEQIAAGKAAQGVQKAVQVSTDEQVKAQQLPEGEARKELNKEWSRD